MAVIKTATGCLLYSGFDIYPLTLHEGDCIEFNCLTAVPGGTHLISEQMTDDGEGTSGHVHTTLTVDLAEINVLPGVYDWDLKLVLSNGTKMPLLGKRYNRLIVEESEG